MKSSQMLVGFVAWRLIGCLFTKSYYHPDEYYQSVEVAHKVVFGYGYTTWEWVEGIRSYIFPGFFMIFYKIAELLGWSKQYFIMVRINLYE
jgi:phosphatidylinositol glycan class B